jgi:hypothetical protein
MYCIISSIHPSSSYESLRIRTESKPNMLPIKLTHNQNDVKPCLNFLSAPVEGGILTFCAGEGTLIIVWLYTGDGEEEVHTVSARTGLIAWSMAILLVLYRNYHKTFISPLLKKLYF